MTSYGMHRFFVLPEHIYGETVTLVGEVADQLVRVLRARRGDRIVVLDDTGWEHVVILESLNRKEIHGRVTNRFKSKGEPEIKITLYQAVLKSNRFDFVLQKCTELGVSEFVPIICDRSVPRTAEHHTTPRHQRGLKIITEAAEQSCRGRIPLLKPAVRFSDACEVANGLALIFWEEENKNGLKAVLDETNKGGFSPSSVSIFIGPEGGLTQQEIHIACENGLLPVSLGPRVLRSETAAIVATTAIFYGLGELGRAG